MKYNANNLDEFISDKDRVNAMIFKPSEQLVNGILENRLNVIEDKIKELISPYIDTTATERELIQLIGKSKYKLGHVVHIDYEEYYIINTTNDTKDYFLTRHKVNLEELKSWLTISEIVRGIICD